MAEMLSAQRIEELREWAATHESNWILQIPRDHLAVMVDRMKELERLLTPISPEENRLIGATIVNTFDDGGRGRGGAIVSYLGMVMRPISFDDTFKDIAVRFRHYADWGPRITEPRAVIYCGPSMDEIIAEAKALIRAIGIRESKKGSHRKKFLRNLNR